MATVQSEKTLELKVGAFVLVGLAVLAGLVVQFGRVGEGFKTYYGLTVKFPDASGLLKGSDVLLAGAKIGRVSGGPRLVQSGEGVEVPLRIFDYVKIPEGSKFSVGSSGLLGDRFVAVAMPPGAPESYIARNSVIEGTRETGLDDLTREGGFLVSDLRTAVENVNNTISRLNNEALSDVNLLNLKMSVENLNTATAALAQSTQKIDGVIEKAGRHHGFDEESRGRRAGRDRRCAQDHSSRDGSNPAGDEWKGGFRGLADQSGTGERLARPGQQPASARRSFLPG